jgi:hypothetical protein
MTPFLGVGAGNAIEVRYLLRTFMLMLRLTVDTGRFRFEGSSPPPFYKLVERVARS